MSFLSGINPISLTATFAMGPMGGMMSNLISRAGQQLIQNLGQALNLPPETIDAAQSVFAGASGDFGGAFGNMRDAVEGLGNRFNASLSDIADGQRSMQKTLNHIVSQMSESKEFKEAKAGHGKGSAPGWLMAMAEVLGKKLDDLSHEMEQRAASISESDPSSSAEFGVVSQQFSMLMNATNNAIKTVGESLGKVADKN